MQDRPLRRSRARTGFRIGRVGLALGGLSFGVLFAFQEACGGSKDDGPAAASKGPPAAEGAPTTSAEERVFAVDTISLGEADRAGARNKDAWKRYGFDLDGRITVVTDQSSPDLKNVCARTPNARAVIHNDGEQGTDNAFGKEIVPILDTLAPNPSRTVTESIRAGAFTVLLKVVGLTDDAAQSNTGLGGTILVGGDYKSPPAFDQATDWPYVAGTEVPLSGAYVTKGVFVSKSPSAATLKLSLTIRGQSLDVVVHGAIVSFKHDSATQSLQEGTIAGTIDTEEFVAAISGVAGSLNPDFCAGSPTLKSVQDTIRQASDILADGQDPARTCNAISIGIGFTAKRVAIPTKVAEPVPKPPDPCTTPRDAGADR